MTRGMAVSSFLSDVSDSYHRRARLFPGFTTTLPVSLLAVVLVTTKPAWWSAVVLVLGASGVSYFGAQLVRTAGKSKEQQLWASWGGPPTTQMLRFDGARNRIEVQRRYEQLAGLFPDVPLPDEEEERADPRLADERYETVVHALIERTRDPAEFPRIFDELCQYGFRRNLWGCRRFGLWLAILGLGATAALGVVRGFDLLNVSILGLSASAVVDALLLLALALVVRPGWVREVAEAYAQRLMGGLETLAQDEQGKQRNQKA